MKSLKRAISGRVTNRTVVLAAIALSGLASQAFASVESKVDALLAQMTLDEKVGQMVQVDMPALHDKADVQTYFLGSMLSGGDSDPSDNHSQTWSQAVNEYQSWALKTRLKSRCFTALMPFMATTILMEL